MLSVFRIDMKKTDANERAERGKRFQYVRQNIIVLHTRTLRNFKIFFSTADCSSAGAHLRENLRTGHFSRCTRASGRRWNRPLCF